MTAIELGDQEQAFFLRDNKSYTPEERIAMHLEYLECPFIEHYCHFKLNPELRKITPRIPIFRMIFGHFKEKHYNNEKVVGFNRDFIKKEHTKFENIIYGILQELVIFEANKGGPGNFNRRNAC